MENKKQFVSDVYMKTEHRRNNGKLKKKFLSVVNKTMIGVVVLSSIFGANAMPSLADDSINQALNETTTIQQEINYSVEEAIEELDWVTEYVDFLEDGKALNDFYVDEAIDALQRLEEVVLASDNGTTKEVVRAIKDSEKSFDYVNPSERKTEGLEEIARIKENLGIRSTTISEEDKVQIDAEENLAGVNLTDIDNHWGKGTINKLVGMGAINGYTDGTFKPDNTISRAEFLAIVMRSTYKPSQTEQGSGNHWASGILETAYDTGVVYTDEIRDTDDSLNKPITRYEMARILVRANMEVQEEGRVSAFDVDNAIEDYNGLPKEYKPYVEQSYMKGFIGGYPDGTFGGSKTGTRAEAATMVLRLLDKNERVEVDVSADEVVELSEGEKVLNTIPDYTTDMGAGLSFSGVGYTVEDAAFFVEDYVSHRANYNGTDVEAMEAWADELATYVTSTSEEGVNNLKNNIIDKESVSIADVYVDAKKIEIRDGAFYAHVVIHEQTENEIYKGTVKIGGHDVNKGTLTVGSHDWELVK